MSGLIAKTKRETVFLVIKDHSICEEAKSAREGFEEVHRKNPKTNQMVTKFIRQFDAVEGFVTNVEWYDTKKQYETRYMGYKVHMDAAGQPVVLDLPFKTRPYDAFVKFAGNIDWTKEVRFSAWHDRKGDCTAFCARQDDAVVRHKYTRENPGKCPPPTHDDITGWDFKAQRIWLKEQLDSVVLPAVQLAHEERETAKRHFVNSERDPQKARAAAAGGTESNESEWADEPPNEDEIPF
jgi:hypothetical protein